MYTVAWHVEGEVLIIELSDVILSQDLKVLNDYIIQTYLDPAQREIHLIVDGAKITKLPANIAEVASASKELSEHPKLGLSIYVNMVNPLVAFLANTVAKVLGYPYKMCKSMQEAQEILERYQSKNR